MSEWQVGTWDDPAIIGDGRIADGSPIVRAVAERLHNNESSHMHKYIQGVVCPYCALRASRCIRWFAEAVAGLPLTHDTPFGLISQERETQDPAAGQDPAAFGYLDRLAAGVVKAAEAFGADVTEEVRRLIDASRGQSGGDRT